MGTQPVAQSCAQMSTTNALQTDQRCRNRAVCGLDRRRFGFLSQKSVHGCGKLAHELAFLQTPKAPLVTPASNLSAGDQLHYRETTAKTVGSI